MSQETFLGHLEHIHLNTLIDRPTELTIGSCFSVHYRVMEHAGSLDSTKEA